VLVLLARGVEGGLAVAGVAALERRDLLGGGGDFQVAALGGAGGDLLAVAGGGVVVQPRRQPRRIERAAQRDERLAHLPLGGEPHQHAHHGQERRRRARRDADGAPVHLRDRLPGGILAGRARREVREHDRRQQQEHPQQVRAQPGEQPRRRQ
jgi:hypothetical protein